MSNRPTVLQIGPLPGRTAERLNADWHVLRLWEQADRDAYLAEHGAEVRAVLTSANHGCDGATIERLPNLEVICNWGVGYDKVDVATAHARGVAVSNTPDVLDGCVADMAWGLLIATARRIGHGERFVRAGEWKGTHSSAFPLGWRVHGKRLGVLGLGRIGQTIARRGAGFDMDVRYHNRSQRPDAPWQYMDSATALAEWADFLVVACVGGASTHHLVNDEVIRALGPRGTLVNISRGSVIDETALIQALEEGALGGAGLDVFEHEPQVPEALRTRDNVVVLPHIASATEETRRAMEDLVFENLNAWFQEGKLRTPV